MRSSKLKCPFETHTQKNFLRGKKKKKNFLNFGRQEEEFKNSPNLYTCKKGGKRKNWGHVCSVVLMSEVRAGNVIDKAFFNSAAQEVERVTEGEKWNGINQ